MSLKEVVEAVGLGTVERKELTPDKVVTYTDQEGNPKTETLKSSGEWVLKDNYFKTLKATVKHQGTLLESNENTLKANKQKIVELDNDNQKLQELVLEIKKDLDLDLLVINNGRKGGAVWFNLILPLP